MADALDIITVQEFEQAINARDDLSGEASERAQVVTAASRMVDQVFGPVVRRTITGETHDGGSERIWPKQTPVLSITSVVEYDFTTPATLTAETNTTKPSSGYHAVLNGHNAYLVRRSTGLDYPFACGRGNVVITYEAGRYDDTESVDARFKEATALAAVHLWQARGSGSGFAEGDGAPFGGVPFSSSHLVQKLRDMLPDDVRQSWVA